VLSEVLKGSVAIYFFIFFAKLLEVSIATIRIVLTARGNRVVASIIAGVEVTIWLLVFTTVLGDLQDPFAIVAYVAAFMAGIYMGILIEDKLALGLAQVEVIAETDEAREIVGKLRGCGYGVTTFECEGFEGKKTSIVMKLHRKDVPSTVALLKEYDHLFATVTDLRKVSIGSIKRQMIVK